MNNFCKFVLENGGDIIPLIIPSELTNGTGIFNPSIYLDPLTNKLIVNIRHCQVVLYHSDKRIFESPWGPLTYMNPEDDITLTTTNYLCELDHETLEISKYYKVDTSKLDVKPIWEFIGLEDCRLVRWDNKLYGIGVRRDTTPNGQGRMEFSQLSWPTTPVIELTRNRIAAPGQNNTYCEKNWMPIVDLPYHFVKWSNPTEVVQVNLETNSSKTVYLGSYVNMPYDFRGGSQVIRLNDKYRFACVHTVDLYKSEVGKKDATYKHCFAIWDNDWNVYKYTEPFSFLDTKIEFCTGMQEYNNNYLISFGLQDNASYILKTPKHILENICLS